MNILVQTPTEVNVHCMRSTVLVPPKVMYGRSLTFRCYIDKMRSKDWLPIFN